MEFAKRLKEIDISGIRKMFELASDKDIINLGIGEPDFDIPPESKRAVTEALEKDFTHYTPNKGIPELRSELKKKLQKENRIKTSAEDIIVTSGASEALHLAIQALVNPDDEVLIPDPGFVSYAPLVRLAGGNPVGYPVKEENEFEPVIQDISSKITERTKLMIINSPSNPTGAVFSKETIKSLAELADERDIPLASDEVYEKIIYKGKHISPARYTDRAITINGFSKSYAMTGLRLGYINADTDIIEEMLKVHQYIQASTVSISQAAALAALKSSDTYIDKMVKKFKKRRNLIVDEINAIPNIDCKTPKGAFYIFPNFESYGGSNIVMKLLKGAKVVTTPGSAFGKNGNDYIRFSYAANEENIKEGISNIKSYLEAEK